MATVGVEFERLNLNVLKQEGKTRLRLYKFDPLGSSETMGDPLPPRWWLYDILSILVHLIQCLILALPPFFIVILKMTKTAQLSALYEQNTVSQVDLFYE